MMDRGRKTEGGASLRSLLGFTGEFVALLQIELGQGGARLEHNDVT